MSTRIFIDGQVGTTGLGIARRLQEAGDFSLITLSDSDRKQPQARREAMALADVTVLCLPDVAAREAVALAPEGARILDSSTAHRVVDGRVYGFAEALPGQAHRIATAARVANPGCYATGCIALLRPLISLELLAPDAPVSINAISGYSGGGKAMIADHQTHNGPAFELYGLGLNHKHLPEIMRYGGLTRTPVFVPAVGHFAQGMLICMPLFLDQLSLPGTAANLADAYADYYAGQDNVVVHRGLWHEPLDPQVLNNTDKLEIFVCANEAAGQMVVIARLDNLGKGASGAAVQNIKLMTKENHG